MSTALAPLFVPPIPRQRPNYSMTAMNPVAAAYLGRARPVG